MSKLTKDTIQRTYQQHPPPEVIATMPLHWKKTTIRGFNQAFPLASYLAKHLELSLRANLCKRTQYTHPQHLLPRKKRLRSVEGAFTASPSCKGLRIALVDDVVTTSRAASSALLKAGAKSVDIWCIARTPLD